MKREEEIRRLKEDARKYLATPDLPGSQAAGADSNAELAAILLDKANRLEIQS